MRLSSVIEKLENRIPLSWSEGWDNPGLLAGDPRSDIVRISVGLDASAENVRRAADSGSNLLVTHHPAFLKPLDSICPTSPEGRTVIEAVRRDVALYGIHTNWDSSPEGVNCVLAGKVDLVNVVPLSNAPGGAWGTGAFGMLRSTLKLSALGELLKEAWGLKWIRGIGLENTPIRKIALCGGSGGDMLQYALGMGADAYVTADMKHHQIQEGWSAGLAILVCDHGEMEAASLDRLTDLIISETGLPAEKLSHVSPAGFFSCEKPGFLSEE